MGLPSRAAIAAHWSTVPVAWNDGSVRRMKHDDDYCGVWSTLKERHGEEGACGLIRACCPGGRPGAALTRLIAERTSRHFGERSNAATIALACERAAEEAQA